MKLTFELRTLSPVHIGSGEVLTEGLDYIRDGRQIGIVSLRKMRDALGDELFAKFVGSLDGRTDVWKQLKQLRNTIQLSDVCDRLLNVASEGSSRELREHIRTGFGDLFIPGSSIKGSFMGAVYADSAWRKLNPKDAIRQTTNKRNGRTSWSDTELTKKYLGSFEASLGRFLCFNDVHLHNSTTAIELATLNSHPQRNSDASDWGFKPGVRQWVETIPEGSTGELEISIGQRQAEFYRSKLLNNPVKPLKDLPSGAYDLLNQPERLFEAQNNAAERILKYESDYFDTPDEVGKSNADQRALDGFKETIAELLRQVPKGKADRFLMQVGFGQGWNGITGGWMKSGEKFEDLYFEIADTIRGPRYQGLTFPKTRKMTTEGIVAGWIELKLIDKKP